MKILFVGETWKGSSARSLREGLTMQPDVALDEIGEDHYFSKGRSLVVRGANRVLAHWHRSELEREIEIKLHNFRPDVFLVYKGGNVSADAVRIAKRAGAFTVNVFPDYSPHAYGSRLKAAVGSYDLVVSTKPFHPAAWRSVYGYENNCVCVPHGYDPAVHYWAYAADVQDLDVVLAASWRPQYERLMLDLVAELAESRISVALAGPGWEKSRARFPAHWQFPGALFGRAYGEFVRRAKIAIAPVHSEVVIKGVRQPGDVDTTRSYELAAAGCFFLHRRTLYVRTIYDETNEVPMWDGARELAAHIARYLPDEAERRAMARRAHLRAVPSYSIPARAKAVLNIVKLEMAATTS